MPPDTPPTAVPFLQFEDGYEGYHESDEQARWRAYFPLSPGTPGASDVHAEDLMVVNVELDPGNYLGTHRDSEEELLFVVSGTVAATVGETTVELAPHETAVVPPDVPHSVRNVGEETARVVGFFPDEELTARFEETVLPMDTDVFEIDSNPDD